MSSGEVRFERATPVPVSAAGWTSEDAAVADEGRGDYRVAVRFPYRGKVLPTELERCCLSF
jgi:hypothetical protein